MKLSNSSIEVLAADLAGARIDPNEAQKALAYLRNKKDSKEFFNYLRAINQNGRAVIRSRQTLGYYRDLLTVCERHLRGMEAQDMAETLGWAIRLLRYYRTVPDAAELLASRGVPQSSAPIEPPPPLKATGPVLPAIGEVFTGLVLERGKTQVIIEIPGFQHSKALGMLDVEPNTPMWKEEKDRARVEVIGSGQQGQRTILKLRRGPKVEKEK